MEEQEKEISHILKDLDKLFCETKKKEDDKKHNELVQAFKATREMEMALVSAGYSKKEAREFVIEMITSMSKGNK